VCDRIEKIVAKVNIQTAISYDEMKIKSL